MCHCLLEQHLNMCLSAIYAYVLYSLLDVQPSFLLILVLSGNCSPEVSGAKFHYLRFFATFCNSLSPVVSTHTSVNEEDYVACFSAGRIAWGFDGSPCCRADGAEGSVLSHREHRAVCQCGRKRADS